ncbi:MAG TPA: hypothetical protein VHX44_03825 [Planctomycetota bacterium]|nr:hypothetical protein [Planctomycetota bacterium]
MRQQIIAMSTILGLMSSAQAADSTSLQFSWDFAPQHYDLDVGDSFGREISRRGTFDTNDRAGLRYLSDMGSIGANAGWFWGGEVAYARYDDEDLRFKTLSFSAIIGLSVEPVEWWRGSVHARFGIAFDEADISYDLLQAGGIASGVVSYGTSGIQYALGVSSDFILSQHIVLSAFAGVQGEYASAVSWWYYYSYPSSYVEVETYGASFGAALGWRF